MTVQEFQPIQWIYTSQEDKLDALDFALAEEEAYWTKQAESLDTSDELKLLDFVKAGIRRIRDKISLMTLGCSGEELKQVVQRSLQELRISAEQFRSGCESYTNNKQTLNSTFQKTSNKINDLQFNFDPISYKEDKPILETSPLSPFDIPEEAKEYIIGKVGHKIKHQYGNSASRWFELGINVLLGPIPENSKNPWRDRLISASVNVTLAETLSLCLPARLPAYLAIAGAHATAKAAKDLEVYVDKLAQNKKFAEIWNAEIELSEHSLSFSESIALCKFTLKGAQVPSELYHAVHHRVISVASLAADACGITDENLTYIAKKTLILLAKYSPEIMEENVWRDAILDIVE